MTEQKLETEVPARLPWYLWGAGASAVGLSFGADRVRCTECGRWTRLPAFYELGRVLCARHHAPRVDKARAWASQVASTE